MYFLGEVRARAFIILFPYLFVLSVVNKILLTSKGIMSNTSGTEVAAAAANFVAVVPS